MIHSAPKIMVVDDEPANLHVMRRMMESLEVEIIEASSGDEALRQVLVHDFFLIVMDVHMSGMDGFETASLIMANRKSAHVPIIFATAISKDERFVAQGYDVGAVDYIYKPIDRDLLLAKVSVFRTLWVNQVKLKESNAELREARELLRLKNIELEHLATHDPLTKLINRKEFSAALEIAVAQVARRGGDLAVLFLDLDNFKGINDTFGHLAGDELLRQIANRLRQSVRKEDVVSRLGGDEFALIMTGINDVKVVDGMARKILDAVSEPVQVADRQHHISVSIGIAIHGRDKVSADDLVECADTAMYQAKTDGRNNYRFYSDDLNNMAAQYAQISSELRTALQSGQIDVYYQPKVDARSGRIVSCEALARWHHPEKGLLPAGAFIEAAENTGLISDISDFVLTKACHTFCEWLEKGAIDQQFESIAVNVSAAQISSKDILAQVAHAISVTGMDPGRLELELTESSLIHDIKRCSEVLHSLKSIGVSLSIDDFGTGYASYRHLQKLPVDTMKVDRSFISKITENPRDMAIVEAMAQMARAVDILVVAEGVETKEQAARLRTIGIQYFQGYLFGKPMPADEFERLVRLQ